MAAARIQLCGSTAIVRNTGACPTPDRRPRSKMTDHLPRSQFIDWGNHIVKWRGNYKNI
jgi:hypothetical protein